MSDAVVAALIAAAGAITVALVGLLRQAWVDRRAKRIAQTERELNNNSSLLAQYRELLAEVRTELDRRDELLEQERTDSDRIRRERDDFRRRALRCEDQWDRLKQDKERP